MTDASSSRTSGCLVIWLVVGGIAIQAAWPYIQVVTEDTSDLQADDEGERRAAGGCWPQAAEPLDPGRAWARWGPIAP